MTLGRKASENPERYPDCPSSISFPWRAWVGFWLEAGHRGMTEDSRIALKALLLFWTTVSPWWPVFPGSLPLTASPVSLGYTALCREPLQA